MKHEWDDFDCSLATSLSELPPPEKTVRDVTPWRDAIFRIVLGLCLSSYNLGFWYLDYILPVVGRAQLYLGFRALRGNNRWFRLAWYSSICEAIYAYVVSVLFATPLVQVISTYSMVQGVLDSGLKISMFLAFHFGLVQAAREVSETPQSSPALWAAAWWAILTLLALIAPNTGGLSFFLMLIAFICIVRSLLRVTKELESWGYAVRAAPVRCSARRFSALYLGSLLILVLLCAAWSNHIPAEGTSVTASDSPEISAMEEHLIDLGFPEELLSRLPEEEIEQLSTATSCVVDRGRNGAGSKKGIQAFGFDTVYVETGPHTFRVYEFFQLKKDTLRSNWRVLTQLDADTNGTISDISCGVTWTKEGISYRGYPSITEQIHEDFFFGSSTLPSAVFSYPFFSRNRGGYVAYTTVLEDDCILFCSILRTYLTTAKSFYPYTDLSTDFFQTDWYAQSYSTCQIQPN